MGSKNVGNPQSILAPEAPEIEKKKEGVHHYNAASSVNMNYLHWKTYGLKTYARKANGKKIKGLGGCIQRTPALKERLGKTAGRGKQLASFAHVNLGGCVKEKGAEVKGKGET